MKFLALLAGVFICSCSQAGAVTPKATPGKPKAEPIARREPKEKKKNQVQVSSSGSVVSRAKASFPPEPKAKLPPQPKQKLSSPETLEAKKLEEERASFEELSLEDSLSDYVQRDPSAGAPLDQSDWDPAPNPYQQGPVYVNDPASSDSEVIRLEADNQECLLDDNHLTDCWQRFGSYGIKRLKGVSFVAADQLGKTYPQWMGNRVVRSRKIFNLTFPGTHLSGMYQTSPGVSEADVFGIVTQTMNISEQLKLGIRAFDFTVSWDMTVQAALVSNGLAARPLVPLLQDIKDFLSIFPTELVLISVRKDTNPAARKLVQPLINEENEFYKIPGQSIHAIMDAVFGTTLITLPRLTSLPSDQTVENPTLGSLIDANLQVLYFYEGQQVLCTTYLSCSNTPGWQAPPVAGTSLPFGPPMVLGARQMSLSHSAYAGMETAEPACIVNAQGSILGRNATALVTSIKEWVRADTQISAAMLPNCFPSDATLPKVTQPTLMWNLQAVLKYTKGQVSIGNTLLNHSSAAFSRGEGFTARSEAEHANFLLLTEVFEQFWSLQSLLPNIIQFDFVTPIFVERIIHVMQNLPDCGFAIHCVPTGSCWSLSKLSEDGSCNADGTLDVSLASMAGFPDVSDPVLSTVNTKTAGFAQTGSALFGIMVGLFSCCCCVCCCGYCGMQIQQRALRKRQALAAAESETLKQTEL